MVKKVIYECSLCNISTHLKTDFKRHINTRKHQNAIKNNENLEGHLKNLKYVDPNGPKMDPNGPKMDHKCKYCNKYYSNNSHMNRHMKKCIKNETVSLTIDESNDNEAKLSEYIKVIEKENELIKKEKKDMQKENKLIKKEKKAMGKENELIKKEKKAMGKEIEKLIDKVGNITTNNNMLQQNIIINNYGNENLDYLTEGYLTSLLKIPCGSVLTLLHL